MTADIVTGAGAWVYFVPVERSGKGLVCFTLLALEGYLVRVRKPADASRPGQNVRFSLCRY